MTRQAPDRFDEGEHAHERWDDDFPSDRYNRVGKIPVTARLSPAANVTVFRVGDAETARALGEGLGGNDHGRGDDACDIAAGADDPRLRFESCLGTDLVGERGAAVKRDAGETTQRSQALPLPPPSLLQFSMAARDEAPAAAAAAPEPLLQTAAAGVQGSGTPLPHLERIQQAFGHHDVGGVAAHVGGAAAAANEQMGSDAYAMGNDIAFHHDPSLHTAAHEAAHAIQQRAGIRIAGGVGAGGDAHERHADAVADAVVAGGDAAALLDLVAAGRGEMPAEALVQYKRPDPVPVDGGMASAGMAIQMGGEIFGQKDWKKEVDWKGLTAWLGTVTENEKKLTSTINPKLDADLAAVERVRDDYKLRMTEAFERERPKIEEIIHDDTDVRGFVEEIRKTGASIEGQFTQKSAALTDVDASANEMVAAISTQQKHAAEKDEKKAQGSLEGVKADKAKALEELMAIPGLITGAVEIGKDIVAKGPAAVAAAKAKGLTEKLVMMAYKSWAEKTVADKYDVTIKNIQFKIRNLQSQIQTLEDKAASAAVAAAAGRGRAAAARVKAADTEIANLSKHVESTRKTLSILVEQKYKEVSVFKLGHEATQALREPLKIYLASLCDSKTCLTSFAPWRGYYTQLNSITLKASGLDVLEGGPMPALGLPKRTPAEVAKLQETTAQISQFTSWLGKFGYYVESEQTHIDSEIEKVQSGGYLDFVQEIETKIVGML